MLFEDDSMCLDDEDLEFMQYALHNHGLGVEEIFDRPVSPPPVPSVPPVPPVPPVTPVPPVPARNKAWTKQQDAWLAEKYSNKPNTGISEDTERYWALCVTEFERTYGQVRTVAALVKRVSLCKLSNGRKRVGASSKRVGASSTYQQWDLNVQMWITRNVPANAHLSHSYLQSVASAFHRDNQNTPTRTISAWRGKIKRMHRHLK